MRFTVDLSAAQAAEWLEAWEDVPVGQPLPNMPYEGAAVALRDAILAGVRESGVSS